MIYFDMDGTLSNLYGVKDWLPRIRKFDASVYKEAEALIDISELESLLIDIQSMGIEIGIISALAKVSNDAFDKKVMNNKMEWLNTHFKNVRWDKIIIIPYDVPKEQFGTNGDIIFDDSKSVRENWCGIAYDESNIINNLKAIVGENGE